MHSIKYYAPAPLFIVACTKRDLFYCQKLTYNRRNTIYSVSMTYSQTPLKVQQLNLLLETP